MNYNILYFHYLTVRKSTITKTMSDTDEKITPTIPLYTVGDGDG